MEYAFYFFAGYGAGALALYLIKIIKNKLTKNND